MARGCKIRMTEQFMKQKILKFLFLIIPMALAMCSCDGRTPCIPPPKGFSEKDLVGTWSAGLNQDTLIIKSDGTYRQIVHHIDPNIDYTSGWQRWWLEYHQDGIPYLYLEGMSLCGEDPSWNCSQVANYGDDSCNNHHISVENGEVLLVLGVPRPLFSIGISSSPRILLLIP